MATRRQAPQTQASRLSDQEDDMRAIDCPCGHHLEATDDVELLASAASTSQTTTPDMQRTDEQIRERVAADAYEATVAA